MIAASLLLVFLVAKVAAIWGRPIPADVLTPIALGWQDMVVVLAFALYERTAPRKWMVLVPYAALVAFAAINVPVQRELTSPLTVQMLRATSGTIGNSIGASVTWANVAGILVVVTTGFLAPMILSRFPVTRARPAAIAAATLALVIVCTGPAAAARIDTAGLGRNPVFALAQSAMPRVRSVAADMDWRASSAPAADDLGSLRGAGRGKNVLMVVLESTAAQYLGAYGAQDDPMPVLTALSRDALVFENAYALYPESVKGMIASFASRYPAFDVPAEKHTSVMAPSIASALRAKGYRTGLFHSGRFMYLGMDELVQGAGFDTAMDAGDIGGNRNSSFGIDEPSAVRAVLRWIDSTPRGTPFFAAYLPVAGHHPYTHDSRAYAGDAAFDHYRNALRDADAALGALFDGLRARGLDTNTMIVVFGDHGEAFGQHPGNYAHTLAIYDENVRIPFLIKGVGSGEWGVERVKRIASLLDVAPTVLDLLGMAPPSAFDGTSLLDPTPRAALFFTDYSIGLLGLRDGCTKFIHEIETGRSRLFDVCADPRERIDLAQLRPSDVTAYERRLKGWSSAQVARIHR